MPHAFAPVRLWAGEDAFDTHPDQVLADLADVYDPVARNVTLVAALGEVVDFNMIIAGDGTLDIATEDLLAGSHRIASENIDVFRAHSVKVDRWPGWHIRSVPPDRRQPHVPDVLVPVSAAKGGLPARVRSSRGERLRLWFDVHVPPGANPDRYRSRIRIIRNGLEASTVSLTVNVLPFVIHPDSAAPMLVDVDQRRLMRGAGGREPASLAAAMQSAARLLHEHDLCPQFPFLHPAVSGASADNLRVNWDDYDRLAKSLITGQAFDDRQPLRRWRVPFDEHFPPPPSYGALGSPLHAQVVTRYLEQAQAHFRELGAIGQAYLMLPGDKLGTAESNESVRHFGYIARRAAPDLRTVARVSPIDLSVFGWRGFAFADLVEFVDTWCPPAQFLDPSRGASSWLVVDRPPFSGTCAIQASPADTRVIAWQAFDAGVRAVHLGVANNWPKDPSASLQSCIDHDPATLIYPGTPFGLSEPVASVRLKRLRRGVQDVAYLSLLRSHGDDATIRMMLSSLIRHYGTDAYGVHLAHGRCDPWVVDERYWSLARRLMARAITQSLPADVAANVAVAQAIDPIRFRDDLRRIRLTVRGVRMLPAADGVEAGALVHCVLEIENGTNDPVQGTIRFADTPVGWDVQPGGLTLSPLAPGERRIVSLEAQAASLGWNENGVLELPVELNTGDNQTTRVTARLCVVTPQRLERPLTIDGDVDDWPVGVGNYASDFQPVSGPPDGDDADRKPAAAHETLCSVAYDQTHLYLGFRCKTDKGALRGATGESGRPLDDLVPTGSDKVEVLLDPLAGPARLPCRIIRLVISQRGVTLHEGIETDPPVCDVRTWPAVVKHGVAVYTDRWTAEVAIPIGAFGESWKPGAIMGLNFARFDAASQAYSNWSGAVGNTYDPLSFGNMTIP